MFNRPTLPDLLTRTRGDLAAKLPGADLALRRAVTRVLADVHAGGCHELHGHLAWIADQILVSKAEGEFLVRHGLQWDVTQNPATQAAGNVTLTGTNGATIPAATVLRRADGYEYTVDAEVTIIGGTATAKVTSVDYAEAANCDAGIRLTLASPIAGVQSAGQVAAGGLTGGTDIETESAYRARILERIRQPPEGGSKADYIRWAKSVPGVTRVWVGNDLGPGSVVVRFVRDGDNGGIFPDSNAIDEVADAIASKAPFPADWHVDAPSPVPVNFSIWLSPSTDAVRDAVHAELDDLIAREAAPGATLRLSHINEAISIAAGEVDHHLIAPAADVTFGPAEMGTRGVVEWT
jgi:uncharacterized phage protein gp47/JayE